ncbi:hypothetical protein [Isorropodon fossajaponicum symbiont]
MTHWVNYSAAIQRAIMKDLKERNIDE